MDNALGISGRFQKENVTRQLRLSNDSMAWWSAYFHQLITQQTTTVRPFCLFTFFDIRMMSTTIQLALITAVVVNNDKDNVHWSKCLSFTSVLICECILRHSHCLLFIIQSQSVRQSSMLVSVCVCECERTMHTQQQEHNFQCDYQ